MAIVLFSALVDGVRGKVGGNVFSAASAGPYVRSWGKGGNPRVALAQSARANFGGLGAAWQGLSAAERANWDALAVTDPEPRYNAFGDPIVLTGWNYFASCNQRRLQNGQDLILVCPTGTEATRPNEVASPVFSVSITPLQRFRLTWTAPGTGSTDYVLVFVMVIPSGAPVWDPNVVRFIVSSNIETGQVDAYAEFISRFGNVRPGWTCFGFCYRQRLSGIRSLPDKISDTT